MDFFKKVSLKINFEQRIIKETENNTKAQKNIQSTKESIFPVHKHRNERAALKNVRTFLAMRRVFATTIPL